MSIVRAKRGIWYEEVVNAAGLHLPPGDGTEVLIVTEVEGGSGTDFGVPSVITSAARRIAWHALDHAWEIEDRIL